MIASQEPHLATPSWKQILDELGLCLSAQKKDYQTSLDKTEVCFGLTLEKSAGKGTRTASAL